MGSEIKSPATIMEGVHQDLFWWAARIRYVRSRLESWRAQLVETEDGRMQSRLKRWIERYEVREAKIAKIGLEGVRYFLAIRSSYFDRPVFVATSVEASPEIEDVLDEWISDEG